ncbi:GNAT family N-acetyltransferase [Paenibacillus sp. NPDC058174]|uniref:GNAT family N-acetyltransferase n=1 Tax=Paenibacillus sp. NPDC058174 TaxID=3346366 RepID=UPI0036D97EEB
MGTGQVIIRETTASDLPEIESLLLDAYVQYAQVLPEEVWSGYREDILYNARSSEAWHKLHAVYENKVAGSVFLFGPSLSESDIEKRRAGAPFVRLLAVHPSARGKGVATALLQHCARLSADQGKDYLYLNTSDMMSDAVRLYENLGFERIPEFERNNSGIWIKSYKLNLQTTRLLHA